MQLKQGHTHKVLSGVLVKNSLTTWTSEPHSHSVFCFDHVSPKSESGQGTRRFGFKWDKQKSMANILLNVVKKKKKDSKQTLATFS